MRRTLDMQSCIHEIFETLGYSSDITFHSVSLTLDNTENNFQKSWNEQRWKLMYTITVEMLEKFMCKDNFG